MNEWMTTAEISKVLTDRGFNLSLRTVQNRIKTAIENATDLETVQRKSLINAKVSEYHIDFVNRVFPGLADTSPVITPEVVQTQDDKSEVQSGDTFPAEIQIVPTTGRRLGYGGHIPNQIISQGLTIDVESLAKAEQYLDLELEITEGEIELENEVQSEFEQRMQRIKEKHDRLKDLMHQRQLKAAENNALNRMLAFQNQGSLGNG